MSTRNCAEAKRQRREQRELRRGRHNDYYRYRLLVQALCVLFSGGALSPNRERRRGNATHGSLKRWVP